MDMIDQILADWHPYNTLHKQIGEDVAWTLNGWAAHKHSA